MSRLVDALLTTDPVQRVRVAQAGLAMLLMVAGVAALHYFVWIGVAAPVLWWSLGTLVGMGVFFGLIRGGWSRTWAEPSLALPQMLFALASSAVAYTLLGAGRGAVFPVTMVVLLMSDTRAVLARGGLERLQQKVQALRILHGTAAVGVTLSAGLAEHRAGEGVAQTLARAEHAWQEAKAQGTGRVVVAV